MASLRYFGEFKSVDGNLYRIEILQDGSFTPQEITLAGNPVTIEWDEVDKMEPVMSSSATLRLVSMTDRQFVDMYTVEATSIRLNIYRSGALYWSGTLDTELFEEPYYLTDRYVTELTFSDFAQLSRLKWQMQGYATIQSIVEECLRISNIEYNGIIKYVATTVEGSTADLLSTSLLSNYNFYDEDGEAWNVREVLDEVLRPFALRLKQKAGQIIIADIHSLASLSPQEIEWRAADSVLGVEPTYNRAVVEFSPYSEVVLFNGEFDYDKTLKNEEDIERTLGVVIPDASYLDFTVKVSPEYSSGLTKVQNLNIGNGVRVFRIDPEEGGEETAGVMWGIRHLNEWVGRAPINKTIDYPYTQGVIMQSDKIPILSGSLSYRLALSIEVLYDVRRNPYEAAGGSNEEGNWERFNDWANYGAIPVKLILYGQDGNTYSFSNKEIFYDETDSLYGEWVEGSEGVMWLEFYNTGDRTSSTGFGGWQKNKQSIGFWAGDLLAAQTIHIDSEKIPMPPVAGDVQLSIYAGVLARDNNDNNQYPDVASISRWLLYRNPKIYVVKYTGAEIDAEDVEVSAWINKAAEEKLSISTYIGSAYNRIPFAKGLILNSSYKPIAKFTRAAITDYLENLLLGTVYSNYAQRKNTIEGSIKLIPDEQILSDTSFVSSRFLVLSERQELQTEVSTVKMAEIVEDKYVGIEYGADV